VYGKAPALTSAAKQGAWIEKQLAKYSGEPQAAKPAASLSSFARFYKGKP
jgi:hypothetical protein